MRHGWLMMAALPLMGCGAAEGQSNGSAYARAVATQEAATCTRARAPTPAHAAHLRRLCACLEAKTAGSDIQASDGEDAINARLRRFADECMAEVGDGSELPLPANSQ